MDLTSQTNERVTAALLAAEANSVEILQILKDNGADLTRKNREGLMPADIMIAKHDVIFDGPRGSVTISNPEPEPARRKKKKKHKKKHRSKKKERARTQEQVQNALVIHNPALRSYHRTSVHARSSR